MGSHTIIRYDEHVPDIQQAFEGIEALLASKGFDTSLHHLVKLRASQINGCGFCVKMHTLEARRDGETDKRLDRLVVWRHVKDYTAAEKAALTWTEALTKLDPSCNYEGARAGLLAHFTEQQISVLTSIIVMINLWNRLQVSNH